MRNMFSDVFYEAAKRDPSIVLVVADISPAGSVHKFRTEFPERFFNVGIAEQTMIGMAAGMALRGLKPVCYTIATFSLFRPYEFVRDDICYQNLDVTIVGIGGGISYSTLGATHHSMEDIPLAGNLPNMTVLAPCDPLETRQATQWFLQGNRGPVYMRIGRAGEPNLTENAIDSFALSRLRYLRHGSDIAILSYGPILATAANIADCFEQDYSVSLISVPTLKPIDRDGLERVLSRYPRVIVIEEATPYLGPLVERIAWQIQSPVIIETFGLHDKFYHCYSPGPELMKLHGLTYDELLARLT